MNQKNILENFKSLAPHFSLISTVSFSFFSIFIREVTGFSNERCPVTGIMHQAKKEDALGLLKSK